LALISIAAYSARTKGDEAMDENLNRAVDRHVGSRVRMRRLMLRMTQEALGEALGITFQQVQKYEKGVNRISASRLQHIARIFKVPAPFFFDGAPGGADGAAEPPSYVADFLATSDGLALAEAFMRIGDARLRRTIAGLVRIAPISSHNRRPEHRQGRGVSFRSSSRAKFTAIRRASSRSSTPAWWGRLWIVPEVEPTNSLAGGILDPIRFWVLNDMPRRWKSAGCH
jgi:transcriptional regulator with XRE-family HTH domain